MQTRIWMTWLAVNAVFAWCHPSLLDGVPGAPPLIGSLAVNLALFVLPAAGWSRVAPIRSRAVGLRAATILLWSTAVLLASLAVLAVLGIPLTATSAWTTIWAATNLGYLVAAFRRSPAPQRRVLLRHEIAVGVLCGAVAYVAFVAGATRVVPPLEDQDLEVSGTAVGLLTRLEPLLLTDRKTVYFFAHPPLLHGYVGGAYLLYGALPALEFYDEASRRVRDARDGRPIQPPDDPLRIAGHPATLPAPPGQYTIAGVRDDDYVLVDDDGHSTDVAIDDVELDRVYSRYRDDPRPLESRTPNIFFAAATVALLAIWAGRVSRRWWLGVLVAAAYATSPEVFVRSSYGGYFAAGGLIALLVLMASGRIPRGRWSAERRGRTTVAVLLGVLAALIDHKLVVLPFVLASLHVWRTWHGPPTRGLWPWIHPVAFGFAAGTAAFWAWGLAIDPSAFVSDHLRGHLVDRVLHHNPLGYGGYLSPLGLWGEFTRHTGWLLLPGALVLFGADLWRTRSTAHTRWPSVDRAAWLGWILVTAVVFTLIDWRMTKHVMPLALPLCLAVVPDGTSPRHRLLAAVAILIVVLTSNTWDLGVIIRDFARFTVTPVW